MAKPRIAIVDTGSGNLRSVEKALTVAGGDPFVTRDAEQVAAADKVVVPGQGAFGACMAGLMRDGGSLRIVRAWRLHHELRGAARILEVQGAAPQGGTREVFR